MRLYLGYIISTTISGVEVVLSLSLQKLSYPLTELELNVEQGEQAHQKT